MAFIKLHLPCPSCPSSDALCVDEDGRAYCFSCGKSFSQQEYNVMDKDSAQPPVSLVTNNSEPINFEQEGDFYSLDDRGISKATATKFGVRSTRGTDGKINKHIYPYYSEMEVIGTKTRVVISKDFYSKGNLKEAGLFGEQLFRNGGKYITVVEGECDAMAAYEMLGSKWPVVSIRSGAQSAERDIKNSIEFLESFDNVIICFDSDKAGREASKRAARLLKPSKAKIMSLPEGFKDANEMLIKHQQAGFVKYWWEAKTYTPSGVVNVSENLNKFINREKKESIPYPWGGLNTKLEGLRQGELVLLTGGTGLGKSSVTRELEHWIINHTNDNVGIIALEENEERTMDGIVSIEADAKLHIDRIRNQYTEEELTDYFNTVFKGENKDRVWIHAHFGANDIDAIFSKLRFMIIGCNCRWVVLDHLHMMVSSSVEGDERRSIDSIMTRLRSLVEETGVGLILVSHLRRIDGNRGHENGVETSVSHIRGSQSIAQISDAILSLERNQQSDDPIEASTTKVRILKSRYTGDVGIATHLLYDNETGRLSELAGDELSNSDSEDGEINLEFE